MTTATPNSLIRHAQLTIKKSKPVGPAMPSSISQKAISDLPNQSKLMALTILRILNIKRLFATQEILIVSLSRRIRWMRTLS